MAETIGNLAVVITASDKATPTIGKVKTALSDAVKPTRSLTDAFAEFREGPGLANLGRTLSTTQSHVASFARSMSTAVIPLSGAGLVGGTIGATTQFLNTGRQLMRGAADLRTTVPDLHAFRNAAELVGYDAEEATDGLRSFDRTIYEAATGQNQRAAAASTYERLGISLRDAAGNIRSGVDAMPDFARAFQKLAGRPNEQREFLELWGAAGMGRLFKGGPEALRRLIEEGRGLGVMTREQAERADRLARQWNRLKVEGSNLSTTIGGTLAPALGQAMDGIDRFLRVNEQGISAGLRRNVETVSGTLSGFVTLTDKAITSTIGWERALDVLEVLIASRLLKSLTGINLLAGAFRIPAALAAFMAWAGGKAGEKNMPVLDDQGREVGNWGGSEGERNARRDADNRTPIPGWQPGLPPGVGGGIGEWLGRTFGGGNLPQNRGNGMPGSTGAAGGAALDKAAEARKAYDFWTGKGFTPAGASAMVSMEQGEGGLGNAGARGDYVNGVAAAHGLYQHHPDRRAVIQSNTGINMSTATADQQREAMYQEMARGLDVQSGLAFNSIKNATDARVAAGVAVRMVERPRDRDGEALRRGAVAQDWMNRLNQPPPASVAAPAPPAPAPTPLAAPVRSPLDGPPAPPQQAGSVDVNVRFQNAPRGLITTVRPEGNVNADTPRVETSMAPIL